MLFRNVACSSQHVSGFAGVEEYDMVFKYLAIAWWAGQPFSCGGASRCPVCVKCLLEISHVSVSWLNFMHWWGIIIMADSRQWRWIGGGCCCDYTLAFDIISENGSASDWYSKGGGMWLVAVTNATWRWIAARFFLLGGY